MNHERLRAKNGARRRKKQAPRQPKARSPKGKTIWVQLQAPTREELHKLLDMALDEVKRPKKFQIPFLADEHADEPTVTATGSKPGIVIEAVGMLHASKQQSKLKLRRSYGGDYPRAYVVHIPGFHPVSIKIPKPRGRPPLDPAFIERAESLRKQGYSPSETAIKMRLLRKDDSPKEAGERIRSALRRRRSPGKKSD